MPEIDLTQAQADALIKMEKNRISDRQYLFPIGGQSISVPLQSTDGREQFRLDISLGRIDIRKVKMQNRARQVVVLVRLDLGGPPHRNPDGEEIGTPHIHIYREGYGDKWAFPVPCDSFQEPTDMWKTLNDFYEYCNVTRPPVIRKGLFT